MSEKFTSGACETLYRLSLDGWCDAESGSVGETGAWHGMIRGNVSWLDMIQLRDRTGNLPDMPLSEYREIRTMAGAILTEDSYGFAYLTTYADEPALDSAWAEIEQEDSEAAGPSDDDLVTNDHVHVYEYGRNHIVLETTPETFDTDVSAYMAKEQYWPNVWFVSDHGNAHLLTIA